MVCTVSSIGRFCNVVINVEDTLPIGLDGRGTFRVLSIEVRVHEVNDFKIYNGFEFSSKKVVLSRSLVDGRESGERGERGRKGEGRSSGNPS